MRACHSTIHITHRRNYWELFSMTPVNPVNLWCLGSWGSDVLLGAQTLRIATKISIHQKSNITYIFFFFTAPNCTRADKAFFCMSEDSAS